MDVEKLKQARLELERDQAKWRVEKVTIERAIIKGQHELETINLNLEPQRQANLSIEHDTHVLRQAALDQRQEIADQRHLISQLSTQSTALSTEIADLNQQLSSRKEEMSAELAKYHETVEQDHQLKLNSILNTLDKTERQVKASENKLQMLKLSVSDHQEAEKAAERWLTDYKKKADEEHKAIQQQMTELAATRQRLIDENGSLMAQQLELKQLNRELATQNDGFKAYETKAWAILKAKDQMLQDKDAKLREREQFTPVKGTFLPPAES